MDFKKIVGKKTDEDAEIERYKRILQEEPEGHLKIRLKLGRLYEKIGDNGAAIVEYSTAARLAINAEEPVVAMVANKLIARLDPKDKDALANLAYIKFQEDSGQLKEEFENLLLEIEGPLKSQKEDSSTKPKKSRLALSRRRRSAETTAETTADDGIFEIDRKSLIDMIEGRSEETDTPSLKFESDRKSLVTLIKEQDDEVDDSGPDTGILVDLSAEATDEDSGRDTEVLVDLSAEATDSQKDSGRDTEVLVNLSAEATDSSEDIVSHLQQVPLFSELAHEELRWLGQRIQVHNFAEGSPVAQGRNMKQSLFVILHGQVGLKIEYSCDKQHLLYVTLETGDFLGEHAFFKQDDISFSAITKTACMIAEIPKVAFALLSKKYTSILDSLKQTYKQRCFPPMLACMPLFSHLPDSERQDIAKYFFTMNVRKGNIIITEGEHDESLYFIRDGEVSVSTTLVERGELQVIQVEQERLHLATLKTGDFFGEGAFFTKEPRSATVSASTDVKLLKLPQRYLANILKDYPQVGVSLKECHQRRITNTMKILQEAMS
jgi:CRP/FNR family cyclic AMP-dependent transcriptional regulator